MSTGSGDPVDAAADPSAPLARALAEELARRTGVCWVRAGGRTSPVWHAWCDGALCVVTGGTEQPFPDVEDGAAVEVVMRSKDTGGRLLSWTGTASVVRPGDEAWGATTAALVTARQNLPDPATAADTWAHGSVVRRITPSPSSRSLDLGPDPGPARPAP